MSNESQGTALENGTKSALSIKDPVGQDVLDELRKLHTTRLRCGEQLLDLEDMRVQLIVTSREAMKQHAAIFEKVLLDRGLSPTKAYELDEKTGEISPILDSQGEHVSVQSRAL